MAINLQVTRPATILTDKSRLHQVGAPITRVCAKSKRIALGQDTQVNRLVPAPDKKRTHKAVAAGNRPDLRTLEVVGIKEWTRGKAGQ